MRGSDKFFGNKILRHLIQKRFCQVTARVVDKRAASSHFSPGSNIFKGGKSPDVIEDAMIEANA